MPTKKQWNWAVILAALSFIVSVYGVWLYQTAVPDSQQLLVSQLLEVQEKVQTQINHLKQSAYELEEKANDARTQESARQLQLVATVRRDIKRRAMLTSAYDEEVELAAKRSLNSKRTKGLYNVKRIQEQNYRELLKLTRKVEAELE